MAVTDDAATPQEARGLRERVRALLDDALSEARARMTIGVAMALVTVLATVVAFQQQDAAITADRAERASEVTGLAGVAYDSGRIVQTGTDVGVYRLWFEQLERAASASRQLDSGSEDGDPELLTVLSEVETDLGEWLQKQSILFDERYFDAETLALDFAAYDAELIVGPHARAQHEHDAQLALASAWDGRALTYVTILTVLAASLFFLGLGASLGGAGRRILVVTGALFAVVSLGATAVAAALPPTGVPETAIDEIVTAQVSLARSNYVASQPLGDEDRQHFEDALTAADAAVESGPEYAGSYLTRAEVKTFYADTLYFLDDREPELIEWLLDGAIGDYETYLSQKPDDYAAWWNLGWVQYLAGDPQAAVASTDRALELAPDQFILYQNRALAELALGDEEAADEDIETSLEVAADADLDSTGTYFMLADFNIGWLADLRPDEEEALRDVQSRLREGQVALEVLETAAAEGDPPELDGLTLTTLALSDNGEFTEEEGIEDGGTVSALDRAGLRLDLDIDDVDDETVISVRIWVDRMLDAGSSVDVEVSPEDASDVALDIVSPYGRAGFDLTAGAYEMEVYADANLIGTLTWELSAD